MSRRPQRHRGTRRHCLRLAGALAAAALAWPLPARADPGRCAVATVEAAQALAERAAAFLAERGEAEALRRFADPAGGFATGDLYVFVFDFHGRQRASGGWTGAPRSRGPEDDAAGSIYARIRRLALGEGRGWIEYSWYNPCTRAMEPKATYIVRVGHLIVGVGAYKRPGV